MNSTLAVFMPSWVGDAVMATPTLRALSKLSLPGRPHKLIGIMQPVVAEVLSGGPWIDEQIVYSKRHWSDRLRLAWKLRAAKIDTVLLMTNSGGPQLSYDWPASSSASVMRATDAVGCSPIACQR